VAYPRRHGDGSLRDLFRDLSLRNCSLRCWPIALDASVAGTQGHSGDGRTSRTPISRENKGGDRADEAGSDRQQADDGADPIRAHLSARGRGHALKTVSPRMSRTTKIATKMKNKTRAMSALAADIPVNPKRAAIIEITRKMRAHLSSVMASVLSAVP
jgi:hypothetical protein